MHRLRRYIFAVLAVVLLAVSGSLVQPLHRQQVRYELTSEPIQGVSPGMVLATTALGAFRGIVVDIVWIRMESLKQDGKFFELVQLADLACRLAPRFPKVWDFNAWNLSYNVSAQLPEFTERWPWVKRGIELLRDQGIPNNPNDPQLCFSLAWIYNHKIGEDLDNAHLWYKQALGLEMHEVLGGWGNPELLRLLAEAPGSRAVLLQDQKVKKLYERLVDAGFDPLAREGEEEMRAIFTHLRRPDSVPEEARKILEEEQYREEALRLLIYARARRLKDRKRLDPNKMLELMEKYGPLDWRTPYAHAIYWATEGKRKAIAARARIGRRMRERGQEEIDMMEWAGSQAAWRYELHDIDYDRIIYDSLQNLVTKGRLIFNRRGRMLPMMGPDYRFADSMVRECQKLREKYEGETYFNGVSSAYENFLKRAAVEFYYMGQSENSRRYHRLLVEEFSEKDYPEDYLAFIRRQMPEYDRLKSPAEARNLVGAYLMQYFLLLGAGQDARAAAYRQRAVLATRAWNKEREVDKKPRLSQRVDLQQIMERVLLDIFRGRIGFPAEVLQNLKTRLPQDLLERLEKAIQEQEEAPGMPKPMEVPDKFKRREQ